jgi:RNA polymerase sigma factor (sigma-70 family)
MKHLTQLSDHELVQLALGGNEYAIGILADRYRNFMYVVFYNFFKKRELAKDMVQEASIHVIKAFRNKKFDIKKTNFKAWLFVVCNRLAIDYSRSTKKSMEVSVPKDLLFFYPIIDKEKNPEEVFLYQEAMTIVRSLISRLNFEGERDVLTLRLDGYKCTEVALELGDIPVNTVKARTRNGIKHLRQMLPLAV